MADGTRSRGRRSRRCARRTRSAAQGASARACRRSAPRAHQGIDEEDARGHGQVHAPARGRELARQQQGQDQQQQRQAGREISPQDLQKMMDMIEKLAESGANEAAQDLLAQLDEILRNLQPGQPRQAGPSQDGGPMSEMLDKLTELMRKQQQLMDETQRLPQPGAGDPSGEEGNEPGANGQRGDPNGLAGEQESLGDLLESDDAAVGPERLIGAR
ncbi:MAG: DUF4175 domain-containing protein, partial [Rhizobiales bacterium]|nr:DUF4175 domain-containing protein [Hyphomicrobiales bacterium]